MNRNKFHNLLLTWVLVAITGMSVHAQDERSKSVYWFSFKYLNESFAQKVGGGMLTHLNRSGVLETTYEFASGRAHPVPVYTNAFGAFTMTYEPSVRVVEVGSNFSLSLNAPMVLGLSIVDVKVGDGFRFKPREDGQLDNLGRMYNTRSNYLGQGHAEAGGLLMMNIGNGATVENTKKFGFSMGAGYLYTYAGLKMRDPLIAVREPYREYLHWGHLVGSVNLRTSDIGIEWMFSLLPTRVSFQGLNDVIPRQITTGIYQRVGVSFYL